MNVFTDKLDIDQAIIKLRDVQWIKGERGMKLEQQFSASFVLIVICNGSGNLVLDHRERSLKVGTVYVCEPKHTYGIKVIEQGLEAYLFRFDIYQDMDRTEREARVIRIEELFGEEREIQVRSASKLISQCGNVYKSWHTPGEISQFRSQIDFMELFYHAVIDSQRSAVRNSSEALALTKEYIEERFHENVTIERLASLASLSSKYYVDLYKKTYGISAMEYLSQVRIKRAKNLMARTGGRVRDIAEQVGYHDEFYFSRKFKQQVGVSPKDYMKSRQRKIAAYGHGAIGLLLSLNIMPYAAPLHPKWTRYYYEYYRDDIPVCLSAQLHNIDWEANVEKMLESCPDIVIASGKLRQHEQERIQKGVPVFFLTDEQENWRDQLCSVADALGESAEAQQCLQEYDAKVVQALEKLAPYNDETVLVVRLLGRQMYAHCNRSMREVLYGDLQRTPWNLPLQIQDTPIHLQQIAEMEVDRILVLVCQEARTLAYWRELQTDFQWQQIEAVKNGKIHMIFSDIWREYSIYAHRRAIEDVVALFSGDRP